MQNTHIGLVPPVHLLQSPWESDTASRHTTQTATDGPIHPSSAHITIPPPRSLLSAASLSAYPPISIYTSSSPCSTAGFPMLFHVHKHSLKSN